MRLRLGLCLDMCLHHWIHSGDTWEHTLWVWPTRTIMAKSAGITIVASVLCPVSAERLASGAQLLQCESLRPGVSLLLEQQRRQI